MTNRQARKVFSWVAFVVLLGGWFLMLRPAFLGGPASYVMVSGRSMEPRLHDGDLVVTRKEAEYEVGDIVAFRIPEGESGAGSMVIHRVIGGSGADGYAVQGDNREFADIWHPQDEDVVGRMWFVIPQASVALTWLRTPLGIAAVAALLVFLVVAFDRSQEKQAELETEACSPGENASEDPPQGHPEVREPASRVPARTT